MNAMFFKPDIRFGKVVAIALYKNFIPGEVEHLGKTISGTQLVAFSTSARRDIFFPTNWIKLVIEFKKSSSETPLFFISSAYPDAIGFSQAEALDFQRK